MSTYVIDTHALLFHLISPEKLTKKVLKLTAIEENVFIVPIIVILEIQYLIEIKRVEMNLSDGISYLRTSGQFRLFSYDESVMLASLNITGHRDPFDRIIISTAIANKLHIITRDRWMRSYYSKCIW